MTMLIRQAAAAAANYVPGSLATSANGGVLAWMGGAGAEAVPPYQVYVHDVASGLTRSLGDITPALAGMQADWPALSGDGAKVAFVEANTGRVAVLTLATGVLQYATGGATTPATPGRYAPPSLSADGRYVAFESASSDLVAGDTNGLADVFVRDLASGAITRIERQGSVASTPHISNDGQLVVFRDLNYIYLKNLATGTLTLVSSGSDGMAIPDGALWQNFELSASGRYLTFSASRTGFEGPDAVNFMNVYVKDLVTGSLSMLNSGRPGQQIVNEQPEISGDGSLATYVSREFGNHTQLPTEFLVQGVPGAAASHFLPTSMLPGFYLGESSLSPDGSILGLVYRTSGWISAPDSIELFSVLPDGGLAPGAGNDRIQGSTGLDTLTYGGTRAEYSIANRVVTDSQAARNGSDTLVSVERLHFSDGNIALDTDGVAGQAFRLYQAAFNRTPDQAGVGFWIKALDQGQ